MYVRIFQPVCTRVCDWLSACAKCVYSCAYVVYALHVVVNKFVCVCACVPVRVPESK